MEEPSKTGIITLDNMPNEYIQLEGDLLYETVDKALKFFGTYANLCKSISITKNITKYHGTRSKVRKSISLVNLKKLSEFLVSKNEEVCSLDKLKVVCIGKYDGIPNPVFPINFNTIEGTTVIGDILTDGYIDEKWRMGYTNTNSLQITNNILAMNELFCKHNLDITEKEWSNLENNKEVFETLKGITQKSKLKCRVYKTEQGNSPLYSVKYHACAGKILGKLNIPKGKKVLTNPHIPEFLFSSNKKFVFKFLERVLINEGSISDYDAFISHGIDVDKYIPKTLKILYLTNPQVYEKQMKEMISERVLIPNLLLDYMKLLNLSNCKFYKPHIDRVYTSNKKEIRAIWRIGLSHNTIRLMRNYSNFNSKITKKLSRLKETVQIFPFEERAREVLNIVKEKPVTVKELSNILKVTPSSIYLYVNRLLEEGKLRVSSKKRKQIIYTLNNMPKLNPKV